MVVDGFGFECGLRDDVLCLVFVFILVLFGCALFLGPIGGGTGGKDGN